MFLQYILKWLNSMIRLVRLQQGAEIILRELFVAGKAMEIMKKLKLILGGVITGAVNALFGAGGGMIAVPILKKSGLSQREAQATAVSVILPLTAVSCVLYYIKGNLDLGMSVKYLPFGFIGALIGSFALKKVPDGILKKIFALFMLWAGARMIFK